jgi:hypothetical protein
VRPNLKNNKQTKPTIKKQKIKDKGAWNDTLFGDFNSLLWLKHKAGTSSQCGEIW